MDMKRQSYRDNQFASLRDRYDAAFAMLCHARREWDRRETGVVASEDALTLQKNLDLTMAAYTRARNDLAMWMMEQRRAILARQEYSRAPHRRLMLGCGCVAQA